MAITYGVSASLFGDIPFTALVTKLAARGWTQVEPGFRAAPEADWSADVPGACARLAGAGIAVENLPRRNTPRPGGPIQDVLQIIQDLGGHVGVCVDAGDSSANGLDAAEEVMIAGRKLYAVRPKTSEPRQGVLNFAEVVRETSHPADRQ